METGILLPDESYVDRTSTIVYQRIPENQGQSLVLTPHRVLNDTWNIFTPNSTFRYKDDNPEVTIVICTFGRQESLVATLSSLWKQTNKDFEIILITEKGNLTELRQQGLVYSKRNIVSFIDDDVYCEPSWLESFIKVFKRHKEIVGVTGPTTITDEYRQNRDLFKYKLFKGLYDFLFLGELKNIPSRLSSCGAPSTASNDHEISYSGPCDFLEACNMSVRRKEALDVGGFDSVYSRTSEWCEVDLALKLKQHGTLYFCREASLFHRPSKQGIYSARLSTKHRWANFILFQKRWIKTGVRTSIYRGFIYCYLRMKNLRMI